MNFLQLRLHYFIVDRRGKEKTGKVNRFFQSRGEVFYIFHLYCRFQNIVCMYTCICIHFTYICNCKRIKNSGSVIILKQLHAHIFYCVNITCSQKIANTTVLLLTTRPISNKRTKDITILLEIELILDSILSLPYYLILQEDPRFAIRCALVLILQENTGGLPIRHYDVLCTCFSVYTIIRFNFLRERNT